MSANQTRSGADAVNRRPRRLGASGKSWLLSVVRQNRRFWRAQMPWWCINLATRLRPICRPQRGAQHALRAAVATSAIAMHATDFLDQLAIGGRSHAFRSPSPRVVAAGTDVQHFAHHTHWERRSLVMDKAKLASVDPRRCRWPFLKCPVLSVPRASSFSRRRISACSADVPPEGALGRPGRSALCLPVITPVTQHRGLNTQLSRHLRQWSTTRCQQ